MLDYTRYDAVFPPNAHFPYDRGTVQDIELRRKDLFGSLFIDSVVAAIGIPKSRIYPPKSEGALRTLHQIICDSDIQAQYRQSIFYYILLDYDAAGQDTMHALSENFAEQARLPAKYQTMMRGLWYMDRQDYSAAIEYITHPTLTPDFSNNIVAALVENATKKGDYALVLQYYHTVRPILTSSEAISGLFHALAATSVAQAFLYARTFPDHTREQLLQQLIAIVLGTNGGGDNGKPNTENGHVTEAEPTDDEAEDVITTDRVKELALLPFDSVEETWFEEFLEKGQGRKLRWAKDALVVRRVACGRFAEARSTEGVGSHWKVVLDGLR